MQLISIVSEYSDGLKTFGCVDYANKIDMFIAGILGQQSEELRVIE